MLMNRHLDTHSYVYIVLGVLLLFIGLVGQIFSISTLGASLALGVFCLLASSVKRQIHHLRLIDLWILAYLYFYLGEYIIIRPERLLPFGSYISNLTEGFIVASFGGSLLGYGLFVNYFIRKWVVPSADSSQMTLQGSNSLPEHLQRQRGMSRQTPSTINVSKRQPVPIRVVILVLLLTIILVFYVFQIVTLERLFFAPRAERKEELENEVGSFLSFAQAAITAFPIVAAFLLKRYKFPVVLVWWIFFCSLLAFWAIFAHGSRFPLGFQIVGVAFFLTKGFKMSLREVLGALLIATFLLSGAAAMRATRSMGIGNADSALISEVISEPENYLSSEGILFVNALIHSGRAYSPANRAPDNLFLIYWWMPRSWWPEKPGMAGYWVIRELSGGVKSSRHSVSGGFGMPALLDFGPIAGSFFCIVYGSWIAAFEAYVRRHLHMRSPGSILAALFYFGVFFMMRSLQTSLIFIMTTCIVSVVPFVLLERLVGSFGRKFYSRPLSVVTVPNPRQGE